MASTSIAGEVVQYPESDFDEPTLLVYPVEEKSEISDQETGASPQESDQQISEEQSYRETVRGIRSFMGCNQVPEFESFASSQDDNPFADSRSLIQWKNISPHDFSFP